MPLAAALFTAATFVLTLPLGVRMQQQLPSDLTDTLLTTWILAWDSERIRHGRCKASGMRRFSTPGSADRRHPARLVDPRAAAVSAVNTKPTFYRRGRGTRRV